MKRKRKRKKKERGGTGGRIMRREEGEGEPMRM